MVSRLPASLSIPKVLGMSYQHGSSPRRSFVVAWRRNGSFCKNAALRQPEMGPILRDAAGNPSYAFSLA